MSPSLEDFRSTHFRKKRNRHDVTFLQIFLRSKIYLLGGSEYNDLKVFTHALEEIAEIWPRLDENFIVDVLEADGKGELVVAHLVLGQSTVHQRFVQIEDERILWCLTRFARLKKGDLGARNGEKSYTKIAARFFMASVWGVI